MISVEVIDHNVLIAFWLCFTRWSVILVQLPLFSTMMIPNSIKALSSLVITYAFFPYVQDEILKDIFYLGVNHFWILTIYNVLIGLIIGFFVKSIMDVFLSAGSIITQQMGFSALRYFDNSTSQRVGPFEKVITWTIVLMVLISGALLPMFKGIHNSFTSIHIQDLSKFLNSYEFALHFAKEIFLSALLLASPFIFVNTLIMSVLGIVARMVPQMNVLMMSFVINIGTGLLVFITCSSEFFQVGFKIYSNKLGEWFQYIS